MSANGNSGSSVPRIMVFRPTMEEFQDFSEYIKYIESQGAHKAGIAKIIPPENWCPRKNGYDDIDLVIPAPISQVVTGRQGLFQQINIQKKPMTVKEFKKLAESDKYKTPPHFDYEDLERKYWKNLTYNSPIYGADVSGSLYDKGIKEFNIQHLNTILDLVADDYGIQIEGVNTAYLYFGMWKTTFAWHTEDMDLYSINYLHFGAPKSWYAIPPEHGRRLERLAAGFFNGSFQGCAAFLRHKMTIISPQILKQYSIPFNKITQEPGEFMITFPYGYHSGFNHGFNCAESTNFAMPRWVEYGKRTLQCTCRNDCVKICMDMFVRKFQPERYELWKQGKDIGPHPEDPSRHYAAAPPNKAELAVSARKEDRKKLKSEEFALTQKPKRHPISKVGKNNEIELGKGEKIFHGLDKSDSEETEIYDVNEALKKKAKKKKRDEESDTSTEVIDAKKCKKNKRKPNMKKNPVLLSNSEQPHSGKEIMVPSNSSRTELVNFGNVDNPLPPQLKPFWHREVEKPNNINVNYYVYNQQNIHNEIKKSEEFILDRFPNLKHAISSGTISFSCLNQTAESFQQQNNAYNTASNLAHLSGYSNLNYNAGAPSHLYFPGLQSSVLQSTSNYQSGTLNAQNKALTIKIKTPKSPKASSKVKQKIESIALSQNWKCKQTAKGLKIEVIPSPRLPIAINELPTSSDKNQVKMCSSSLSINTHTIPLPAYSAPVSIFQSHQNLNCSQLSSATKHVSGMCNLSINHNNSNVVDNNTDTSTSQQQHCTEKSKIVKTKRIYEKQKVKKSKWPQLNRVLKSSGDDNWSKVITELWKHQPQNMEAEQRFNMYCSTINPHCAICIIFSSLNLTPSTSFPTEQPEVPSWSKVKMPAFCFTNDFDNQCVIDTNPLLSQDGTAPLLTCAECKVCVHATCYGITSLQSNSWMCSRCSKKDLNAVCCLCMLRGGALKPTTDSRWAHVLCTVFIPETYFENILMKEPINVSHLTASRIKLKCEYCYAPFRYRKKDRGVCIQCQAGKCYKPFHVTCGQASGVVFEAKDWPDPAYIMCTKHIAARRKKRVKRCLTKVEVGDKVLAKHRNRRYYWVKVKEKKNQEYCSVLFEDNSTSSDLLPEDIVSRDCSKQGFPDVGEKLQVKWTDGKTYNCIFNGSLTCEIFVVEFDDGSVDSQKREQVYAVDEELPKEIQSRMSHSTEVQHTDIFTEETEGKRIRYKNTKYKSDNVVPL